MIRSLAVFALLTVSSIVWALPVPISGLSNAETGIVKVQKKKPAAKSGGSCFSNCTAKGKKANRCERECRGK